ncbi:MSMEG_1061 family FMN-dependent PPOX-type flavoprotein [Novosphingobium album (ex Hu et al. 2023)]|uniref:Pyridoxamine 5'-phosphate oxidase family protein n=1 Tax=Novosphingobium album (ex Hu et al. 2023) TaxID=2930093 RepID=A0ABT0B0J8_9SPHN|nr:MSMEG_1061 family FMN-dependent PPOX-type flavoprotein [Novosphingobium album (ex Hu et al. 2023)]MCJ2178577.1 pyridoxamine 5'-phosphate oxidase family protein [Novosphingobium album (ex Hu et al. 2023)]
MARVDTLEHLAELIPDPSPRAAAKVLDHIDTQGAAFIAQSPFLMLGTEGAEGIEISPKGDRPGFVEMVDPRTLLIPERPGNQLKMGLRNIVANGRIALIFLRPGTGDMLRVSGRVELDDDADLCARFTIESKPALLVMRVAVERAFFHCARAALRSGLWEPDTWGQAQRISYGKIYAEALDNPEIEPLFDAITDERNADLWH